MRLNKNYFIMIIFLFTLSCKFQNLSGRYIENSSKMGPDKIEITLEANGDFIYTIWSDILGKHTLEGSWIYNNDTLYLQSNSLPEKYLLTKEERIDRNQQMIKITVLEKNDSLSLTGAQIYINNETKPYLVDSSGIVYFESGKPITTINIHYLDVKESIKLENPYANNIMIYFDMKNMRINPIYLNLKWLIRNRKLIPVEKNGKLMVENYFKRM